MRRLEAEREANTGDKRGDKAGKEARRRLRSCLLLNVRRAAP